MFGAIVMASLLQLGNERMQQVKMPELNIKEQELLMLLIKIYINNVDLHLFAALFHSRVVIVMLW